MAKVIIVDDEPDGARSLAGFLTAGGHTVTVSLSAQDALHKIIEHTPDVVVLDLSMPEMDGAGFLELLRAYRAFQNLPVIVFSGNSSGPEFERAKAFNVEKFFLKGSAAPDEIEAAINAIVSRSNAVPEAHD